MGIMIDFGKTCRYGVVIVAALSALAGMPTGYVSTAHSAQVTETWVGGTGIWSSSGSWSPYLSQYPKNGFKGNTYNVRINSGGYVNLDVDSTIDNLNISSGGGLTILNGQSLRLADNGTITNNGILSLASTGSATYLKMDDATLTGTGKLTMSDNANNHILQGINNATLTNGTGHTIEGSGTIGDISNLVPTTLANYGTVTANQYTPLTLYDTVINTGILQANGGTLNLSGATVTNSDGLIQGLNGSSVDLTSNYSGTTIIGGTLAGIITNSSGSATLKDLTNTGSYTVKDGSTTTLGGTITNNGILSLTSAVSATYLKMSNAMLTGTGKLYMNDSANNHILHGVENATLTNHTDHTIEGSGTIGDISNLVTTTLANYGTVTANQSTSLTLYDTITNTGILQANGGTLNLSGATVTNSDGLIQGLNGSSVDLTSNYSGTTIIGGTLAGTITNRSGSATLTDLTNTGSYTVMNGSTTTLGGTITNNGTMNLDSTGATTSLSMSNAKLTGTGKLTMSDNANNRVLYTNKATLINDTDHTIEGSGIIGTASNLTTTTFTNLGTVTANHQNNALNLYDTVNNSGTFQVNSGSSLVVNNTLTNLSGGKLTGGNYTIAGTMKLPGVVNTNAATIVLDGAGSQLLRNSNGLNALANFSANTADGDFTIKNGRNLTTAGSFSNAGDMTFESGSTFQLGTTGSSTYTQSTGGVTTVNGDIKAGSIVNNGGTLGGTGTINGSVTSNGGTLTPGNSPGTLTINGDLTLDSASTTQIEIGGTTNGQYDVLNINGTATLAGFLDISLWDWTENGTNDPYAPKAGDSFDIISAVSIFGFLTLGDIAPLNDSLNWRLDYLQDAIGSTDIYRLSVVNSTNPVPVPSTLLLFGTGLMSCMGLKKWNKKKTAISQSAV